MKAILSAIAALAAVIATSALARRTTRSGRRAFLPTKRRGIRITAYPIVVRDGENYTSAIAASRSRSCTSRPGKLRVDRCAFGFCRLDLFGGEAIKWELTPLLGGAWGTTRRRAAWRRAWGGEARFYVEGEYVP